MNHTQTAPAGPLDGLRVLDLSTVVMGPFASHLLADMGADVIKLEAPGGDQVRYYRPQRSTAMSGMFLSLHRNKRSLVLDLKNPSSAAALAKVVATVDVVLHNLRPQVAKRNGVTYEDLRVANPNIILCKIYGFGEGGEYGDQPAYDDVIQASSGMADLFRRSQGRPAYVPSMICDKLVGQAAAMAILAACHQRHVKGCGSEVEVPMFETMVAFNLAENLSKDAFDPPYGEIGWARNVSPMRKPFQTLDGYMCLLPYSDSNWRDFLNLAGKAELLEQPKFRTLADRALHIEELYRIVEETARSRTTHQWLAFCAQKDIPAAPVNRLDDLFEDPHLRSVEMFQHGEHPSEGRYRLWRSPIRFDGAPWILRRHAPILGEHSEQVLREAGLSTAELVALRDTGALSGRRQQIA